METEVPSLLFNRSGSPRLQIRGHGVLVEVVDSDREMIYFALRITWPQNQKVFSKHELVVPVTFVYRETEQALLEIGGSLQVDDEQRELIDSVSFIVTYRSRIRNSCHKGQLL